VAHESAPKRACVDPSVAGTGWLDVTKPRPQRDTLLKAGSAFTFDCTFSLSLELLPLIQLALSTDSV